MARRLQDRAGPPLIALLLIPAIAQAQSFQSCWVEHRVDPDRLQADQVTVCRLVTGEVVEYSDGAEPPGPLSPAVGTDSNGECWYRTSAQTDWEILSRFGDGSAILGLRRNGWLVFDTGRIPTCTSEPGDAPDPEDEVEAAITEYVHAPPEPELNPPTGRGLTGMDTFIGVPVPGPWSDTISVTSWTIDVEVWVDLLRVDWGDGTITDYPPDTFTRITGYPDGIASHMYEVKTCNPPGSAPDCHPSHAAYPLTVSYVWAARWRVNDGQWIPIDVPPTSTTVDYPVAEAVSTLTDTG